MCLALFLTVVLLFSFTTPVIAVDNQVTDILFVVNNSAEKESILTNSNIAEYKSDISIEIFTQSDLQGRRIPETKARIFSSRGCATGFPV